MTTIGLSQQEIDDIFRVLAAVLWLGNIQFLENNEGNAAIADESVPTYVAYLMDVDGASVNKVSSLSYAPYNRLLLLGLLRHREVDVEVQFMMSRSTSLKQRQSEMPLPKLSMTNYLTGLFNESTHPCVLEGILTILLAFWISMDSKYSIQTALNNFVSITSTKNCR